MVLLSEVLIDTQAILDDLETSRFHSGSRLGILQDEIKALAQEVYMMDLKKQTLD